MMILEINEKSELFEPLFNVYCKYFPEIERNTLDSVKKYLHECAYHSDWDYICLVALTEDGVIAGGMYLNVFYDICSIVTEFLFVKEEFRGQGIAQTLLDHVHEQFPNFGHVIEVEKSNPVQNFWVKMGFTEVDFEYEQPPIVEGRKPYGGLMLMQRGFVGNDYTWLVETLLKQHYWKYAFV